MVSQNLKVSFRVTVYARNKAHNPLFCLLFLFTFVKAEINLLIRSIIRLSYTTAAILVFYFLFFLFRLSLHIYLHKD